jgi:hypothetical protein
MPGRRDQRGASAWHRARPAREAFAPPPLWLRVVLLAVVVWLAVRIVGNVTESLSGIAGAHRPIPPSVTDIGP